MARLGEIGAERTPDDGYTEALICPRCQIRSLPIGYSGALSRADNETEICSVCGTEEAMADFAGSNAGSKADPRRDWPVHAAPNY